MLLLDTQNQPVCRNVSMKTRNLASFTHQDNAVMREKLRVEVEVDRDITVL
jgi:hypothetical protein